ncbi:hypothetical protein Tco_0339203 [Tanacetum coccineum]
MGDALSRNEKVKSRRVRGMIPAAQSEAFKQENVLAERLHGLEQQMKRKGDKNFLLYGSNLGSMDNSKEWNSSDDQLRLRWMIYLVVLADAAESVRDAIGFEYCLASSSGWTKGTYDSDFGGYNEGMLPVIWAEIRESSLIGPELVLETTYKVVLIKEKLKAARDRQKSYVDFRRKPLESEVGDRVLLKVSPWKGVVHFGKKGKLAPRYVGTFEILERTGLKRLGNANLHVPLNEIKIDKTLRFVEEPVEIMDHEINSLKRSRIPLVKVRWNSKHGPEFTWGREVYMKSKYPQLFVDRAVEPTTCVDNFWKLLVLQTGCNTIQPVAPPSPDYIPGPEDPQTPPVPQDEEEREPMFIQPHDPDFVLEPIYLEYIPLEDEHVFPVEEQPLPPVVSPTAELPGYVIESDPEEDPEEYEDDEIEDGPLDYPMDEGDDRDDDDGDSSGDDADDEDEDEEEEEHLASADSTVIVPTVEPVSPPEGTEPGIAPPSTDISTTGARIIVRLQASISFPPKAKVERLQAMPTPSPSPPISLSPPSAGERLARCTAPPALSSPPPVPSPLLPSSGCPTQIQILRMASTQALIDAVTTALPSPPLPPLPPSLYIPPPVDRRNDLPESEQPPRKRLCSSTLGSRYEVGESSIARPTGGPTEAVPEIAPITVGEVNTRVTELAKLHEHDTQDFYALLEDAQDGDSMDYGGGGLCFSKGLGSLDRIKSGDPSGASDPPRQAQMAETVRVMRDMRLEMSDMQVELLAYREQQRKARQPRPDARIPDHQDASGDADSHI